MEKISSYHCIIVMYSARPIKLISECFDCNLRLADEVMYLSSMSISLIVNVVLVLFFSSKIQITVVNEENIVCSPSTEKTITKSLLPLRWKGHSHAEVIIMKQFVLLHSLQIFYT